MKSQDPEIQEFSWYLDLLCTVYSDVADASPAQHRTEFERDIVTLRSRFEHEGISFLTKVLPSVGKAIDTALASGSVLQIPSFRKKRGTHLPICFGWLLAQVFGSNGVELDSSSSIALKHLRHLLYLFYKLELPYSDESVKRVLDGFINTDSQLQQNWNLTNEDKHIVRNASRIVGRILGGRDPREVYPRHGPGAVSTREQGREKGVFRRLYSSLEEVYPFVDSFHYSLSHTCDRLLSRSEALVEEGVASRRDTERSPQRPSSRDSVRKKQPSRANPLYTVVQCLETLKHGTARVVLVPKDSRGPRLISMEPLEIQWIQQGQMRLLVEILQSHPLTHGQVNFASQQINRDLALEASRHGNLVTLDMKDASDRVSQHLIWTLFPLNWVAALEASRSPETRLPSGEIVKLQKFSPMGSAVCFPLEALCFWSLAVSCLMSKYPYRSMREIAKTVWVYGDDIITYRKDCPEVMQCLEKVGLKFNLSKCCTSGFFRESCGVDAHKGVNVTPTRISRRWCHRSVVPVTLESYCSYSNELYAKGYYGAAAYIEECVQRLTRIPYTNGISGGLSFIRPSSDIVSANRRIGVRLRFSRRYHRLEAFGWTIRAMKFRKPSTDWEELLYTLSSNDRLRQTPEPRMLPSHMPLRLWALNEKSKGSKGVMAAGLYSLPRRVTSERGWFAVT